jgi:molybdopterin/thiamine biosynthesis adenylyltransferase
LGSKIAVTLARSGVRNFYLVDYDLFMPDNIKRHVLNWNDVGEHKTDAVKNVLSNIDKNITVESKTINFTGQESASYLDVCLRKMASCDLIIDATANDRVFNLLASVAKNEQKKFIWTVVFEGGKGGQIARYIPSKDPMPQLIRAACNEFYLKYPLPDAQIVGKYAVENEDGRVFVASDTDVSFIADNAAKFAIDCLAEIYEYEYPVYLIGLGKWWVFKSPLYVIPIDCGHLAVATVEQSAELDDDGKKFLIDLIKKVPVNEGHPA